MATLDTTLVKANSNFTAIYIGIATYDDESIDQLIYSSEQVMTHFARGIRMCSWFSTLMVNMMNTGQSPYTYETLKAADFLLSTWLRVKFPEVRLQTNPIVGTTAYPVSTWGPLTRNMDLEGVVGQFLNPELGDVLGTQLLNTNGRAFQVAWTPNPGHNIIDNAKLYVNDVPIETLDSTWMDLISQFRLSAGKIDQYQAMIGNTPAAVGWTTSGFAGAVDCAPKIPAFEVNVPLPFFYDRDSSTSFPLCGVTLNKVEIRVELRDIQHLLRARIETYIPPQFNLQTGDATKGEHVFIEVPMRNAGARNANLANFIENINQINNNNGAFEIPQMWSRYAVVTKKERNAHSARGCKRDLLIEYVQKSDNSSDEVKLNGNAQNADNSPNKYEFIFNNPVRSLMFVAENVTAQNVYNNFSNYSNNIELAGVGKDYIKEVSFRVDNTVDMYTNVPSVFFTHVDPFYVANRIPNKPGYHALFYCLDLNSLEADGSWNYNKVKGYVTYTYEQPEGYLATGVLVDGCEEPFERDVNLNSLTASDGQTLSLYTSYVYGSNTQNLQARLKIRALAWNVIRIQDNVLGKKQRLRLPKGSYHILIFIKIWREYEPDCVQQRWSKCSGNPLEPLILTMIRKYHGAFLKDIVKIQRIGKSAAKFRSVRNNNRKRFNDFKAYHESGI